MDILNSPKVLYFLAFFSALILGLILTPAARAAALVLNIIDHPTSTVKTHTKPVPYLGGVAIFLSFTLTLFWIRVLTSFPTGTLRSLRGILLGGFFIFLLGLIDDTKIKGLHYKTKFLFQIAAASLIMLFGIHIKFIQPSWLALVLSALWIVGITNSLNLIDIMDGLASSIVFVASLAFLFIALPTEDIYVNFAAAALAGATLGFIPYNLSKSYRIFMGDSGSLFLGFVISALALGTSYSAPSHFGLFAPLLILVLPLYDTVSVFILRSLRGVSPFVGSKDHFALRMEILGWKRKNILIFSVWTTLVFSLGAYLTTKLETTMVLFVYGIAIVLLGLFTNYILKANVR